MVEQKFGRIVNLSSTSALGNRGQANYSAAKAGLQGFTKTLAIELGQFGVTANAIAPGFIVTDMTAATAARVGMDFEDFQKAAAAADPGAPGRPARGRRARRLVPGQRGRRVRLRPGHLRGRRPAVLTDRPTQAADARTSLRQRRSRDVPGRRTTRRRPTGWSSCGPGSTPGWPGCTTRPGSAGRALPRTLQAVVDAEFAAAGAPDNDPSRIGIGLGMAAPTILRLRHRRAEAALAAAAVDRRGGLVPAVQRAGRRLRPGQPGHPGGRATATSWIVNGQKVWTSSAHEARLGACWSPGPTRTCPSTRADLLRRAT